MFEDHYIKATQAADALPTMERRFDAEPPDAANPEGAQSLPALERVAAAAPEPLTEAGIEKERRREERKAKRMEKLNSKRERAKRCDAVREVYFVSVGVFRDARVKGASEGRAWHGRGRGKKWVFCGALGEEIDGARVVLTIPRFRAVGQ